MKDPVSIMSTPEYGIGVARNKFALVDLEEDDPLELLERAEKEKEEKKKAKLQEKENKTKQPAAAKPKPKVLKETQKKSVGEAPKPKEERKPKKEVNFAESRSGNNREQGKENSWYDEDSAAPEGGRDDKGFSTDGFQRGPRGPRREGRGGGGGGGRGEGGNFRGDRGGGFVRTGGRGGGGGGGERRGGGGQRFDSRGKREYDRQSGSDKTGVKPIDKREGSGSHNWGNPQDDWKAPPPQEDDWNNTQDDKWNNAPQNDWNSGQANDWNTPPQDPAGDGEAPAAAQEGGETAGTEGEANPDAAKDQENAEEAEKKEMTLDEWKALKGNREQPKYNIRKAGEGEDLTQWKKMFALNKKKEEEEEEEYEYEYGVYPQRVGRQKRIYDIDIKFKDRRGDEGGRGRGFGRGGRGRGGPGRGGGGGGGGGGFRGGNRDQSPTGGPGPRKEHVPHPNPHRGDHSTPAPKVDDEKDFPSLA